jgi:hypothetical protein
MTSTLGEAGAQHAGCEMRGLQRARAINLEAGSARHSPSAFAVRRDAIVQRRFPNQRQSTVRRRNLAVHPIAVDVLVDDVSGRAHVGDLRRQVLREVMAEEIDARGQVRNVNGLGLKTRRELVP